MVPETSTRTGWGPCNAPGTMNCSENPPVASVDGRSPPRTSRPPTVTELMGAWFRNPLPARDTVAPGGLEEGESSSSSSATWCSTAVAATSPSSVSNSTLTALEEGLGASKGTRNCWVKLPSWSASTGVAVSPVADSYYMSTLTLEPACLLAGNPLPDTSITEPGRLFNGLTVTSLGPTLYSTEPE